MVHSQPVPARQRQSRAAWGVALFTAVALAGLFYAKWHPYFAKAFVAAAHHSIGASIVSGRSAAAPQVGWAAAWGYFVAYGGAIWQALIVGLLVGSGVEALLPRGWLMRVLGRSRYASTAIAGMASIPGMM